MAHKKFIDSVMKHGQVTIKDLDEFLRFILCDYDMRTIDDNYISILLPRQFDINKVFGLDVCDDDYVVLYLCWYPDKDVFGRQFEMRLYHYDNSNDIVNCNGTSSDAYLQLTFSLKHIGFSGGYNFASLFSAEYRKDTGWFVVSGEGEVLMGAKK